MNKILLGGRKHGYSMMTLLNLGHIHATNTNIHIFISIISHSLTQTPDSKTELYSASLFVSTISLKSVCLSNTVVFFPKNGKTHFNDCL